jgi:DNA-binding XRE family transcriptional regulator
MTTFATSLKSEIARVARKTLRDEISGLRKVVTAHRHEISGLKKELKATQAAVKKLARVRVAPAKPPARSALPVAPEIARSKPGRKVVFTAERLKAQRARLGFTQEQMATLLEVSSLSIWKWESGGAVPRASRLPVIMQRLALGKREAHALVESLSS